MHIRFQLCVMHAMVSNWHGQLPPGVGANWGTWFGCWACALESCPEGMLAVALKFGIRSDSQVVSSMVCHTMSDCASKAHVEGSRAVACKSLRQLSCSSHRFIL
jgi:hypothetical protein